MRRIVAAVLIFVLTVFTPSAGAYPQVDSVVPLVDQNGRSYCSAFVINKEKQLLLTADHCMDAPYAPTIDGVTAFEIFHIKELDASVLFAPGLMPYRKELNARVDVKVDEEIVVYGYGKGQLTIQEGRVIFPMIWFDPDYPPFMVWRPGVIPGMSGGPVIAKKDGLVIGINQLSTSVHNISAAVSLSLIVEATKDYWGDE